MFGMFGKTLQATLSRGRGGLIVSLKPIFAALRGPKGQVDTTLSRNTTIQKGENLRHWRRSSSNLCLTFITAFSVFAGLIGPAVPAVGQVPFVCNDQAFITQDLSPNIKETYLFVVDQSVWPHQFSDPIPLTSPSGGPLAINNLGFNSNDGFLYGWRRNPQYREIVRIDANGTVTGLGLAGLPDEPFMAGDITPDGTKMYFAAVSHINGGSVDLYTVPLPVDSGPTTFETCWGDGSAASPDDRTQNVADWAVSPLDGLLYGADREGELAILDPATYERRDLPVGLASGEGYGAAWFNAAGRLFLYRNRGEAPNTGEVFEIDVATEEPWIVSGYPVSESKRNDGAACNTRITSTVFEREFDFGTDTSPVAPGYIAVGDYGSFEATRGWGWFPDDTGVETLDHAAGSDVERDLHRMNVGTFRVAVPNRPYKVELVIGDTEPVDTIAVSVEGGDDGNIVPEQGEFTELTFFRTVVDGFLDVTIAAIGEPSETAVINALRITEGCSVGEGRKVCTDGSCQVVGLNERQCAMICDPQNEESCTEAGPPAGWVLRGYANRRTAADLLEWPTYDPFAPDTPTYSPGIAFSPASGQEFLEDNRGLGMFGFIDDVLVDPTDPVEQGLDPRRMRCDHGGFLPPLDIDCEGSSSKRIGAIMSDSTLDPGGVSPDDGLRKIGGQVAGFTPHCTATYIGPRHLLTAAHCLYDRRADAWIVQPFQKFTPGLNGTYSIFELTDDHPEFNQVDNENNDNHPIGRETIYWYIVPQAWVTDGGSRHDYGMIVTNISSQADLYARSNSGATDPYFRGDVSVKDWPYTFFQTGYPDWRITNPDFEQHYLGAEYSVYSPDALHELWAFSCNGRPCLGFQWSQMCYGSTEPGGAAILAGCWSAKGDSGSPLFAQDRIAGILSSGCDFSSPLVSKCQDPDECAWRDGDPDERSCTVYAPINSESAANIEAWLSDFCGWRNFFSLGPLGMGYGCVSL